MQVDHIIPEQLLGDPKRLKKVLERFGLLNDFDLNSYENWLPSCGPCNQSKGTKLFDPEPIIQLVLKRAADKAGTARKLEAKAVSDAKLAQAINEINRAVESATLEEKHVDAIIASFREHSPELLKGVYEGYSSGRGDIMGLAYQRFKPAKIPLTPFHTVVMEDEWKVVVSTPYGTGIMPKGDKIDGGIRCGFCGFLLGLGTGPGAFPAECWMTIDRVIKTLKSAGCCQLLETENGRGAMSCSMTANLICVVSQGLGLRF